MTSDATTHRTLCQYALIINLLYASFTPFTTSLAAETPPNIATEETKENHTEEEPYPISIVPNEPEFTLENRLLPELPHPHWFKDSFLNLPQEIREARQDNKGLILYFGQHNCPFCDALLNVTFSQSDIIRYVQTYFETIAIDVWGQLIVTTFDHIEMSEQIFAEGQEAFYTPTMIFYDKTGKETLRLRGYYSPYQFRAALNYILSQEYKTRKFEEYLKLTEKPIQTNSLNDLFMQPPYNLNRQYVPSQRLLIVLFEQKECHACELFYAELLRDKELTTLLAEMDIVRLDLWSDTTLLVTPNGEYTNARNWAATLNLFFTPTLVIFNQQGKELIRISDINNLIQFKKILNEIAAQEK